MTAIKKEGVAIMGIGTLGLLSTLYYLQLQATRANKATALNRYKEATAIAASALKEAAGKTATSINPQSAEQGTTLLLHTPLPADLVLRILDFMPPKPKPEPEPEPKYQPINTDLVWHGV